MIKIQRLGDILKLEEGEEATHENTIIEVSRDQLVATSESVYSP